MWLLMNNFSCGGKGSPTMQVRLNKCAMFYCLSTGQSFDKLCPWCLSPSTTNSWERGKLPANLDNTAIVDCLPNVMSYSDTENILETIQSVHHSIDRSNRNFSHFRRRQACTLAMREWRKYERERGRELQKDRQREIEVWIGSFHRIIVQGQWGPVGHGQQISSFWFKVGEKGTLYSIKNCHSWEVADVLVGVWTT